MGFGGAGACPLASLDLGCFVRYGFPVELDLRSWAPCVGATVAGGLCGGILKGLGVEGRRPCVQPGGWLHAARGTRAWPTSGGPWSLGG